MKLRSLILPISVLFLTTMLEDLIELLRKIVSQRKPVGLEINYDGRKFSWRFKVSNIRAEEWNLVLNGMQKGPDKE